MSGTLSGERVSCMSSDTCGGTGGGDNAIASRAVCVTLQLWWRTRRTRRARMSSAVFRIVAACCSAECCVVELSLAGAPAPAEVAAGGGRAGRSSTDSEAVHVLLLFSAFDEGTARWRPSAREGAAVAADVSRGSSEEERSVNESSAASVVV